MLSKGMQTRAHVGGKPGVSVSYTYRGVVWCAQKSHDILLARDPLFV